MNLMFFRQRSDEIKDPKPITAIRRQRQLLRFALTASERLNRLSDPRQHG